MNERVIQFRVGVMVLSSIIITAILLVLFKGFPKLGERPYTVYVAFHMAPGISDGTPIRKNGLLIGRVSKIEFAEDRGLKMTGGGVVATCAIESKIKLHKDETVVLNKSLLGDAIIEFVPTHGLQDKTGILQNGDLVYGQAALDPLQSLANVEGDLSVTFKSIAHTSDEIGALAQRLNGLLKTNDEQLQRIVGKTEKVIDQLSRTTTNIDEVLGDPKFKDNLRQVVSDLPTTINDARDAISRMKQTFETADRNLQNMEGFTKPLGDNGARLVQNIDRATTQLDNVMQEVGRFSQRINSPNGSLGKLINDPSLYNEISATVDNLNHMTDELKPILRDARAFSDKVSRHPEKLGIRGAIFPSTGIK